MLVIEAIKRNTNENLATFRKEGKIPAVFYGAGKESTPLAINLVEFKKVWRDAGESSAVQVAAGDEKVDVLIHEVQVDPITSEPTHVDFLVIDMTKKIRVEVELVFEGISNAVKNGIGNLVKVLHEIEIEALPKDLPHNLVVDISKLETLEDVVLVSDIKLPDGVVAITDGGDVVASVVEQVEEKEEEVAPVDLSTIEVEKKGKKEEEDGEAPAEDKITETGEKSE